MFLFSTDPTLDEFAAKGEKASEIIKGLKDAYAKAVLPETTRETLTAIENEAKKLQRTISGGLTIGASAFREKITSIYNESVKYGMSLQSALDYTTDLNTQMGKMVLPIESVAIDAMVLGHNLGMAEKETGKMVGTFTNFTMSQRTSAVEMAKIAKTARQMGLDAKTLLNTMSTSLTKLNAFNFEGGIDGLTKMNAEAQKLGITSEKLGVFNLAEKLVDPEKAIEVAANLGMLGGSVQEMTNSFNLMSDATNDVDKLQSNIINMAKSHFAIDELTGSITTNAMEQQKMRAEAQALEVDFEEYAKAGRAAAKEEMITNQLRKEGFDLLQFNEEQQSLIKSLAEIGPGGKIDLNLPNFSTEDLAKSVKDNPDQIKTALKAYQDAADMSDRQIAEKGLNIQETQQKDTRIIRDTLLRQLSETEKQTMIDAVYKGQESVSTAVAGAAKVDVSGAKKALNKTSDVFKGGKKNFTDLKKTETEVEEEAVAAEEKAKKGEDTAFGSTNNKVLMLGKNEMFKFIKEDEAIFAPNLIENVNKLKEVYLNYMDIGKSIPAEVKIPEFKIPEIPSKNLNQTVNNTTKTETQSTQNINITITVDGKNVSNLTNIDPSVYKDIDKKIKDTIQNVNFWDKSKTRIAGKQ
jgi:hypothetical protein